MTFSLGTLFPLPIRLWLGRRLFGTDEPKAVRVSLHRLIKGPCQLSELEAMQYVAKHTSVPIPRIYATHLYEDHVYIEMEYVKGIDLAVAWMTEGYLSEMDKKGILEDIQNYIGQLRKLTPPTQGLVASALQNPVHDCRIGSLSFGPLCLDEFHALLRGQLSLQDCAQVFGEEVVVVHSQSYRTYFTHADLLPRNIIVHNGHVAAIIDWAFSGWYPEYWEFTKAHYDLFPLQDWYAVLRKAIDCYDVELAAERSLWRKYDEPGNVRKKSRS